MWSLMRGSAGYPWAGSGCAPGLLDREVANRQGRESDARISGPFSCRQELPRYQLQLGWLQDQANCLALLIVTGKRVRAHGLIEDQRQMSVCGRDLCATGKARLAVKQDLSALVVHAGGVPPPW
jgi:hypothetical protein